MGSHRRNAHLDMDAFYASVKLLRYPELHGQPVVIGGRRVDQPVLGPDGVRRFARLKDDVGRGVITTSTFAARALDVFSAMGIMKAARLAPSGLSHQGAWTEIRARMCDGQTFGLLVRCSPRLASPSCHLSFAFRSRGLGCRSTGRGRLGGTSTLC